jgi:hypothetical protein
MHRTSTASMQVTNTTPHPIQPLEPARHPHGPVISLPAPGEEFCLDVNGRILNWRNRQESDAKTFPTAVARACECWRTFTRAGGTGRAFYVVVWTTAITLNDLQLLVRRR